MKKETVTLILSGQRFYCLPADFDFTKPYEIRDEGVPIFVPLVLCSQLLYDDEAKSYLRVPVQKGFERMFPKAVWCSYFEIDKAGKEIAMDYNIKV